MKIITRSEAKAEGLARYFTGNPCKWGHVAERYTCKGVCIECSMAYKEAKPGMDRAYYVKNAEKIKERMKRYRADNNERIKASDAAHRLAHKEKIYFRKAAWYKKNKLHVLKKVDKYRSDNAEKLRLYQSCYRRSKATVLREYMRDWVSKNLDRVRVFRRARASRVRVATPPWVDISSIGLFYSLCPDGYHVDHFVPLAGRTPDGLMVSGLHVEWNLRYLPASQNCSRGNRLSSQDMLELESPYCANAGSIARPPC